MPSRARASSPQRLEFDLTEELGYRYPDFSDRDEPAIAALARVCNRAFEARYGDANGHKRKARARLDEELALIDELGLAGFFLLHWEVLELAADVAREVRGRESPRHSLPPGRGRGSSVGSLVCYLTGLSHVDPGRRRPLARTIPQPRARLRPRHRPRLPARHPREADRRAHRALRARARRPRRELLHLPLARGDPRSRQGARPAVRRARAARAHHRRKPEAHRRGDRQASRRRDEAPLAALARPRRALAGNRRPSAPHLAAPGRDGHLEPPARGARPGAARGHGGAADLPVGQGLVRRRGLPEDRPARPGHALGGRGLRRPDRNLARRDDRPLADPARRSRGLRGDPARGHRRRLPDREPRADAEPAPHAPGEPRRPDRPGRARPAGPDPGQGSPSVHRASRSGCARIRSSSRRSTIRCSPSRSRRRSASSSSRTRCSRWRSRSPASAWGRPRGCDGR